ncbi:hypothetical protein ACLOJK_025045 [Asimina triloba]
MPEARDPAIKLFGKTIPVQACRTPEEKSQLFSIPDEEKMKREAHNEDQKDERESYSQYQSSG